MRPSSIPESLRVVKSEPDATRKETKKNPQARPTPAPAAQQRPQTNVPRAVVMSIIIKSYRHATRHETQAPKRLETPGTTRQTAAAAQPSSAARKTGAPGFHEEAPSFFPRPTPSAPNSLALRTTRRRALRAVAQAVQPPWAFWASRISRSPRPCPLPIPACPSTVGGRRCWAGLRGWDGKGRGAWPEGFRS